MISKKALSSVLVIVLLLLLTISLYIVFINWYEPFFQQKYGEVQSNVQSDDVTFEQFEGTKLFLRNYASSDINYSSIKIGDTVCQISGVLSANSLQSIDTSSCGPISAGIKDITLMSNSGVFENRIHHSDNPLFMVEFKLGMTCSIGYTKIYAMDSVSNAHAEIPSANLYTYSVCAKHMNYTLSTTCSGIYTKLFYLGDTTNSHVWLNNASAYVPYLGYYHWNPICLRSSGGVFTLKYNATSPGSDYRCFGSYLQDDSLGGMMGSCSAYPNKIWIRLV